MFNIWTSKQYQIDSSSANTIISRLIQLQLLLKLRICQTFDYQKIKAQKQQKHLNGVNQNKFDKLIFKKSIWMQKEFEQKHNNSMMQTENSFPPSANLIRPDANQQLLNLIVYNQVSFNINMREYEEKHSKVLLIWVIIVLLGASTPLMYIDIALGIGQFPYFISIGAGFIPISCLVICNRKILSDMIVTWSILTNITLIVISIFLALGINLIGATLSTYSAIQIISSLFLMKNKGTILIKMLGYAQLIVVGFKKDGYIQLDWSSIVYGIVIFFVLLCVLILLLSIYIIAGIFLAEQSMGFIKRQRLIFFMLVLLCICAVFSTPLCYIYVNNNYAPTIISSIIFYFITTIFIFKKQVGISISLCKQVYKVDKKPEPPQLKLCQENTVTTLYKVSDNWMTAQPDQLSEVVSLEMNECVACIVKKADTTWMPCGHCSMCLECSRSLLQNNAKCPLCKQEPSHILKLKKIPSMKTKEKQNKVEVEESYVVNYSDSTS